MDALLYNRITSGTAHTQSRRDNAAYVLDNPKLFADLLSIACDISDRNHHKALWIIELVTEQDIALLQPFLQKFCEALPHWTHDGAVRCAAKICMFESEHISKNTSEINQKHIKIITEKCFDWMIDDSKVAAKAYSMRALYELGKLQDWIYPELQEILQSDFPKSSAGYKAAAKDVLRKMNRVTKV